MKNLVIDKLSILITTAFGLVAALAWNDAIKSLFKEKGALYFLASHGPWIYAILITILAVALAVYFGKLAENIKKTDLRISLRKKKKK